MGMKFSQLTLKCIIAASTCATLASVAGAQQTGIVDLTKPPKSAARDPLGQPGGTGIKLVFKGGDVPVPAPGYPLPLALELQSVMPMGQGKLVVEVLVRNSGPTPFYLPVLMDPNRSSVLPGNIERRIFQFQINIHVPGQQDVLILGAVTEGSKTRLDSLLELDAGAAVLVRYNVYVPAMEAWQKNGIDALDVQAACTERLIEDDRYFIKDNSATILSTNVIRVRL